MCHSLNMKSITTIWVGCLWLASAPAWAQQQPQPEEAQRTIPVPAASAPLLSVAISNPSESDRMLTPPPVSGEAYPLWFSSEERANYLRGGVTFSSAYSDNVLGATSATPVSDVSYSVWPTIAIDETTTRLHGVLTYAPGFTFYQRTSSRNEMDQNLALDAQYRLSPHVTISLRDSLQKSSNAFNQPGQGLAGAISGTTGGANDSVIAPLADRLSNTGGIGITYQLAANAMIGASGTFSNLHYPDPTQVPGLYDSASRSGSVFYSYRLAKQHYIGVTYQFQQLLSYPSGTTNQTRTDGAFLFYTYYPAPRFSFSLFGGPQYYSAGAQEIGPSSPAVAATQSWSPAGGGSVNWQSAHSSAALSYLHSVSGGGGLIGAVKLDSVNASLRQQITRRLSGSLAATYANNGVLALSALGGHSVSGSVALERHVGEHLSFQAGYTRLHQTYSFFSANPDTNREWVSISYQFARPLGR
jgi:hypothetical protein